MKKELSETLSVFENEAKKVTEKQEWFTKIADTVAKPINADLGHMFSFKDQYPELAKLGIAQTALNQSKFQHNVELAKTVETMCEPYRSTQMWIDDYDKSVKAQLADSFGNLFQPQKYTENITSAFQSTLIPALETCKMEVDINGIESVLNNFSTAIDTSWLHEKSVWSVNTGELLKLAPENVNSFALTNLLSMEQETGKILGENGTLTSIAAQIASITTAYDNPDYHWKDLVAPVSLLDGLQDIALHQHQEIHKSGIASEWRLNLLDDSSRFVDRQVTWTSGFISSIQEHIEEDDGEQENPKDASALSLIPQYISYTKQDGSITVPEDTFEKSIIVEITEKGKKIIENVVKINELCLRTGKDPMFKYTGKLTIGSVNLGRIFCSSNDSFGILIDSFYNIFYENLEHIKELVSDNSVRKEEVYQCIFRVKDMRTDIRHDFEHGNNVSKKRKDIAESYTHYTGKPILTHQEDYVMLQKGLYDDFLSLESHLLEQLSKS